MRLKGEMMRCSDFLEFPTSDRISPLDTLPSFGGRLVALVSGNIRVLLRWGNSVRRKESLGISTAHHLLFQAHINNDNRRQDYNQIFMVFIFIKRIFWAISYGPYVMVI